MSLKERTEVHACPGGSLGHEFGHSEVGQASLPAGPGDSLGSALTPTSLKRPAQRLSQVANKACLVAATLRYRQASTGARAQPNVMMSVLAAALTIGSAPRTSPKEDGRWERT